MTCGTYAGYQRHKMRGETPCAECRVANKVYGQNWRKRNADRVEKYKSRASSYSQAGHKEWRWANPERIREYHFIRRYGLTLTQIDEIFAWQDNRCASCAASLTLGRERQWQIDHCHHTDQIRGVLCARCNRLLSQMGDCAAGVMAHCELLLTYLSRAGDTVETSSGYTFDGDRQPKPRREEQV